METESDMLDCLLNNIDQHNMTYDYDICEDNVAFITTNSGEFMVRVSRVPDHLAVGNEPLDRRPVV